jgi:hypothetical protein
VGSGCVARRKKIKYEELGNVPSTEKDKDLAQITSTEGLNSVIDTTKG